MKNNKISENEKKGRIGNHLLELSLKRKYIPENFTGILIYELRIHEGGIREAKKIIQEHI